MPRRRPPKPNARRAHAWSSHAFSMFRQHLQEMERFFVGTNYFAKFEAHAFELKNDDLPLAEVIRLAYPDSKPEEARIYHVPAHDRDEWTEEMSSYLSLRFAYDRIPSSVAAREAWIRDEFWRLLGQCIDFESSNIVSYLGRDGLPPYDVFWNFTLLIHNVPQRRCLILVGGASD